MVAVAVQMEQTLMAAVVVYMAAAVLVAVPLAVLVRFVSFTPAQLAHSHQLVRGIFNA